MKKRYFFLFFTLFLYNTIFAQWEPQGEDLLPEDYSVWSISIVDENIVWALAYNYDYGQPVDAKLIKTTDGGENWDLIDLNSFESTIILNISAVSDSIAWLSVGDGNSTFKRFIYRTTDAGNSWQVSYEIGAANPNYVWAPAVKFFDQNKGFFIDVNGGNVGYSEDGGDTWTIHDFQYPGGFWGQIDVDNWWNIRGETIIWATSENFMRSTNGGQTWESIPTTFSDYQVHTIQISDSGKGLATGDFQISTSEVINGTFLHSTQDGGASWTGLDPLDFPITALCYIPGTSESFMGVAGIWDAVDSAPPDYQPTSRLTNDGGQTWIEIDTNISYSTVSFINPETGWAGRVRDADYGGSNPAIFKWNGGDVRLITSTEDEILVESLDLSPNPVSSYLYIDSHGTPIEQVDVYTSHGQRIEGLSGGNQNEIDFSDRPSGIYFIHIRLEKGSVVRKVVVE